MTDREPRTRALHGRRRETAVLETTLRALAGDGRGGVLVIRGDRGSGRTALLDDAERRARRLGVQFLRAAATVTDRASPLKPLGDALGRSGSVTRPDAERHLTGAAGRAPVVLAVDDLHEADDATLQAVRILSQRLAARPVLWLLTHAPGRADVTADALVGAGAAGLRLAPLGREDVRALADDVLGGRPSESMVDLLADLGGRPGPIVELLDAMIDERLVAITGGAARLTGQRLRHVLCELGVRRPARDDIASAGAALTRAELAVAELVARGATNRQAAEQLILSPHTVSSHLRHAFEKLGIRSRVELAILFAGAERRTVA